MGLSVGDEVNLVLTLLLLQAVLGAPVVAQAAEAEDEDDGPHQPEPCWDDDDKGAFLKFIENIRLAV